MKGYRTLVIAGLQIAAGIVAVATDAIAALPEDAGIPLIVSGIAFAVLRFVTTTPVFKSTST